MCDCFTCQHSDNIDVLYGYYYSEYQNNKTNYEYLKNLGYKEGSLSDENGIPQLMAVLHYNTMASGSLLDEVKQEFDKKHKKDLPVQLEFNFNPE